MTTGKDVKFICLQCPRSFKLQDFFKKHQEAHKLKKKHTCYICGFVYGAAKGLEGHLKSVHEIKNVLNAKKSTNLETREKLPFELSIQFIQKKNIIGTTNQAKLAQESKILLHKAHHATLAQITKARAFQIPQLSLVPLTINPETILNALSCSEEPKPIKTIEDKSKIPSPAGTGNYKIYDQVPEIKDAADAQQNESGFFHCTICAREFSGLNSLKKHVPIHTRRIQHKCDVCGYVFGKKEYLLDHMRKHTGEISPVCEVCDQTFNKSLKLKEHLKLHKNTATIGNSQENEPFKCHLCKYTFSAAKLLKKHLNNQHSETVYKCDVCFATFGDVRGKNHHMYNEHQFDAFHQKCVWCPVCNQGFTRHYNLKVHMYKSHGREYLENNFSPEELDILMRPPPGSNSSKQTIFPKNLEKEIITFSSLPISPPLTPKLSPKQKYETYEQHEIALDLKIKTKPGPASLTKSKLYFEQEASTILIQCNLCSLKFAKNETFLNHFDEIHTIFDLKTSNMHQSNENAINKHDNKDDLMKNKKRANLIYENTGFKCNQCNKVLMHKQSFVSHMRVIHGDYYGGNKWNGSKVVEMVLGDPALQFLLKKEEFLENHLIEKRITEFNEVEEPETKKIKLFEEDFYKLDVRKNYNNNILIDNNDRKKESKSLMEFYYSQNKATNDNKYKKDNIFIQDRNDNVQFEPVTQEFLFEGQLIRPSYCVLPFIKDREIKKLKEIEEVSFSDDKEKQLIADKLTFNETNISLINNNHSKINNNEVLCKNNQQKISDEDYQKRENLQENFASYKYNHAFALSLSAYLQKKREMSAILVPRFSCTSDFNLENITSTKKNIKVENLNCISNNATVSEYENQVQAEIWPVNCIKCKIMLQDLENFNLHMNDHWSEDKCCPVCGLLINSKRFNFKQHLKIHTGEKPFVCRICSRAFRQKAHMVKHVTTHKIDLNTKNIKNNQISIF